MIFRQRTRRHDQTAICEMRKRRYRSLDFVRIAYINSAHIYTEWGRHRLDNGELSDPPGYRWIAKHCCTGNARCDLFQQFQPFSTQTVFKGHKAGHIAAWSRETIDETAPDRISGNREYNWHCVSCLKQWRKRRAA